MWEIINASAVNLYKFIYSKDDMSDEHEKMGKKCNDVDDCMVKNQ